MAGIDFKTGLRVVYSTFFGTYRGFIKVSSD